MEDKKFLQSLKLFEPEEIEDLCRIASNHDMTVQMLAKRISGLNMRPQVLFDDAELEIVNSRVELYRMDRSSYCIACAKHALQKDYFIGDRVMGLLRCNSRLGYKRNNRVVIAFSSTKDLEDITECAAKMSVKLASFLRYTALYVELPL